MDLDRLYLPHWQFSERHQRLIDAPALPCCTRKPGCSAPIAPAACASPPYWLAIRPVSGLIRRRLLAGIERRLG
ncbi:hypothetical protein AB3I90_005773 [Pseudomonas aeruginosa]